MNTTKSLWPSEQLFVTADTSRALSEVLQPPVQLKFLRNVSTLVGSNVFAESLVYSTPENNTGWTSFRMGSDGHVAYHHWDLANPNLLQFDAYSAGPFDPAHVLQTIRSAWLPSGQRIFVVRRNHPDSPLDVTELSHDLSVRSGISHGLGPGDHLHLLVDQTAKTSSEIDEISLNIAVAELVMQLGMRCMTPVISKKISDRGFVEYNAIVGITTSHVSLRVRSIEGTVSLSLDVFSCRGFKSSVVISWLDRLLPQTESRRAVLFNRYPLGRFTNIE